MRRKEFHAMCRAEPIIPDTIMEPEDWRACGAGFLAFEGEDEVIDDFDPETSRILVDGEECIPYLVSRSGRRAWPLFGHGTAFGPYDSDCAQACGEEVSLAIGERSYEVTHAGPLWRRVYESLLSAAE